MEADEEARRQGRLLELTSMVIERSHELAASQERVRGLLSGILTLSQDLDLTTMHARILQAAAEAVDGTATLRDCPPDNPGVSALGELRPDRLDVPIRMRGRWQSVLSVTRSGSRDFHEIDLGLLQSLAASAGAALENASLYTEELTRRRWLAASREVTNATLSGMGRAGALQLICDRAVEISGASRCVAMIAIGDDHLEVEAAAGEDMESFVGSLIPYDRSIAGVVMRTGEALVTDEADQYPLAQLPRTSKRAVLVPMRRPGSQSVEPVGVLSLGHFETLGSQEETDLEVEMMSAFTVQASLALEFAKADSDKSHVAVLHDRDRISRDLHDLVIQRIFAIGMSVNSLITPELEAFAAQRLSAVVDDLDVTIRDIRQAIAHLQADDAASDRRVQIRRVIKDSMPGMTDRVKTRFLGDFATGIPDRLLTPTLEALRVLLSNVARHARALNVEVAVDVTNGVVMKVTDDGVGMHEDNSDLRSLEAIQALAHSLGGGLEITVPASGGTVAVWSVAGR